MVDLYNCQKFLLYRLAQQFLTFAVCPSDQWPRPPSYYLLQVNQTQPYCGLKPSLLQLDSLF